VVLELGKTDFDNGYTPDKPGGGGNGGNFPQAPDYARAPDRWNFIPNIYYYIAIPFKNIFDFTLSERLQPLIFEFQLLL
jgi:hypothetical protein